jgi:RNA polymerase sigma-70 factor, ECF subfamily
VHSDHRQASREPPPELLERAREGCPEALETLVRLIHPRVYGWCLARTGDRVDADDLCQQVLIQVLRKLDTFRGEARFTSWLFRIVRNEAVSRGRSRARREDRLRELIPQGEAAPPEDGASRAPPEDPAGAVDTERLLSRVEECFLALSPRQRQVFQLVELEGWSAADAARELGVAPATVRVLLLRARRAIREEILRTHAELVEAVLE